MQEGLLVKLRTLQKTFKVFSDTSEFKSSRQELLTFLKKINFMWNIICR